MGGKVSCYIYWPRSKHAKHLLTNPVGPTRKWLVCWCHGFLSWWHTLALVNTWSGFNSQVLNPTILLDHSPWSLWWSQWSLSLWSQFLFLSKGLLANLFRKKVPRTWTNGAQRGKWQTSQHTVQSGGSRDENQSRGPLSAALCLPVPNKAVCNVHYFSLTSEPSRGSHCAKARVANVGWEPAGCRWWVCLPRQLPGDSPILNSEQSPTPTLGAWSHGQTGCINFLGLPQ